MKTLLLILVLSTSCMAQIAFAGFTTRGKAVPWGAGPLIGPVQAPICGSSPSSKCGTFQLFNDMASMFRASFNGVPNRNVMNMYNAFLFWNLVDGNNDNGACPGTPTGPCYDWRTMDTNICAILAGTGTCLNPATWNGPQWFASIWSPVSVNVNSVTPAYVFTPAYATSLGAPNPQDMVNCNNFTGDNSTPFKVADASCVSTCRYNVNTVFACSPSCTNDTTALPVSYELPFYTAWTNFALEVHKHFGPFCSQGQGTAAMQDCTVAQLVAAHIAYQRFGPTVGGEANPSCISSWPVDTGYSSMQDEYTRHSITATNAHLPNGATGNFIQNFIDTLGTSNYAFNDAWLDSFNVHTIANGTKSDADLMASYAVNDVGFPFGSNGLQLLDVFGYPTGPTVADLLKNAILYYGMTPIQDQTFSLSDPTCPMTAAVAASTGLTPCSGTLVAGSGTVSTTGSEVTILPFASAHGITIHEIYPCDFEFTMATSFAAMTHGTSIASSDCQFAFQNSSAGGASAIYTNFGGPGGIYYQTFLGLAFSNQPQNLNSEALITGAATVDGNSSIN